MINGVNMLGRLNRLGAITGGGAAEDAYLLWSSDFTSAGSIDPAITFSRLSGANTFDSAGTRTLLGNGVARANDNQWYDPPTLSPRGFLVEAQRTNWVRNSIAAGATTGIPGVSPTNWAMPGASGNLVSRNIVAVGQENGIDYLEVEWITSGTYSANIQVETATGIPVAVNEVWTLSVYNRLVSGTANVRIGWIVFDSGGTLVSTDQQASSSAMSNSALKNSRQQYSRQLTDAASAFAQPRVTITVSGAQTVRFRIGLPQMERGSPGSATSPIRTTGVSATRVADVALMSGGSFSSRWNASEGTIVFDSRKFVTGTNTFPRVMQIHDGTNNNAIMLLWDDSLSRLYVNVVRSGSVLFELVLGVGLNQLSRYKVAIGYKNNDWAASLNGGAVITSGSGLVPTVDRMSIGGSGVTGDYLNGAVSYAATYSVRKTNAQLQELSAL